MLINDHIINLINYAIGKNLIETEDFDYTYNRMTTLLKVDNAYMNKKPNREINKLSIILNLILDYSFDNDLFSPNTAKQRDLFESRLMDVFSPLPSNLNKTFYHLFNDNCENATNFLYKLSQDNNYIKTNRIAKNVVWQSMTKYGKMDVTINLSKPEKDPRDIIAKSSAKDEVYPKCLLCKENVGFYGNSTSPGRSNHRIIKMDLNEEEFYFQYSPYVYYNEHCIVLMKEHIPMKVSDKTFKRLFDFVDLFPHYFLGSNAGLPIVGGSILSHEHYQGGRHHFPIEDAKEVFIAKIGDISLKYLVWPLSVIRLQSSNKTELIKKATQLFEFWENYSDEEAQIVAYTDKPHNAITPIARKNGNIYTLDMALRNNLTSKELPLGIFHPHPNHHNIKKENIGLIEVMGLAVLPARLKKELSEVKKALKNNEELPDEFNIHRDWLGELRERNNNEDIDKFIEDQVADKFIRCLEDSGVFKQTEKGIKNFNKFIKLLVDDLN